MNERGKRREEAEAVEIARFLNRSTYIDVNCDSCEEKRSNGVQSKAMWKFLRRIK